MIKTISLSELKNLYKEGKSVYFIRGSYGKELQLRRTFPLSIIEFKFVKEPFRHYVYGGGSTDSYVTSFVQIDNPEAKAELQLFKDKEGDGYHVANYSHEYELLIRDHYYDYGSFFLSLEEAQKEYQRRKRLSIDFITQTLNRMTKYIEVGWPEIQDFMEHPKYTECFSANPIDETDPRGVWFVPEYLYEEVQMSKLYPAEFDLPNGHIRITLDDVEFNGVKYDRDEHQLKKGSEVVLYCPTRGYWKTKCIAMSHGFPPIFEDGTLINTEIVGVKNE